MVDPVSRSRGSLEIEHPGSNRRGKPRLVTARQRNKADPARIGLNKELSASRQTQALVVNP